MSDWPLYKRMKEALETGQDLVVWVASWIDEVKQLEADLAEAKVENKEMLEAILHAVEHHRPYVDESGIVCISLQSYAMIRRIQLEHTQPPQRSVSDE